MIDCHIKELINIVQNGKGDSDQHLMTIFSIAVSMKAKRILELGVRSGTTSLPLLLAAKLNDGHVTSVDIDPTTFDVPCDLETHWTFKQMDALKFLKHEAESVSEPYDLIFLDDWHAYMHVKQELEFIDRIVSPRSVILVHDLMYGNYCPHYHSDLTLTSGQWAEGGPYRAIAELPLQFWEFATIPVNNGLTILRKKYSNKYFS